MRSHLASRTQVEYHRSIVDNPGHEVGSIDFCNHRAGLRGDADYPSARNVVHECV